MKIERHETIRVTIDAEEVRCLILAAASRRVAGETEPVLTCDVPPHEPNVSIDTAGAATVLWSSLAEAR